MLEVSKGTDAAAVRATSRMLDLFNWNVEWTVNKWSEDACDWVRAKLGLATDAGIQAALFETLRVTPDIGQVVIEGNLLTNQGIQKMEDQLIGATTSPFNNANSRIGVGNSATAAAAGDTDLGAAAGGTNRQFVVMDATFPSRASQTVTWSASHTSGLSNFHWQEWGIDQGTTNGTTVVAAFLNHKVEDLGTKTTGTWQIQGAITIS